MEPLTSQLIASIGISAIIATSFLGLFGRYRHRHKDKEIHPLRMFLEAVMAGLLGTALNWTLVRFLIVKDIFGIWS
jgi:hypothetical protein